MSFAQEGRIFVVSEIGSFQKLVPLSVDHFFLDQKRATSVVLIEGKTILPFKSIIL